MSHGTMAMPAAPTARELAREVEILVPPEQLARVHLATARVRPARIPVETRVPGTVGPNEYREIRVSPLAGGVVTQVAVQIGETVKPGQVMAQIFSRELAEAQTALVSNEAELEAEHKRLLRTQELVRIGAASREELERVEATHNVHVAHVEEARQKLLLLGLDEEQIAKVRAKQPVGSNISVPAPSEGMVIERKVNPGQVVNAAQELFTVTDLRSVWVEGNLLENDFGAVRVGSAATITTAAYAERRYRGAVTYIDPRVDPETRTARVRVEVENPGMLLRLGMYVDMVFRSAPAGSVVVVPKEAVHSIGESVVVYLPGAEEGSFVQRVIRIGEVSAEGVEVAEGLKAGETVVTEGSVLLRAEAVRQGAK
jgi:RND family efflux transporter MFP subunit